MITPSMTSYDQLLRETRHWLAAPKNQQIHEQQSLREITQLLPWKSPRELGSVTMALVSLSTWYATRGAADVVDGKTTRWNDLHRGLVYAYQRIRILKH